MNNKELLSAISAVEKASAKAQGLIDGIVDAGSFVETDAFVVGAPFADAESALGEGVVTGYAAIEGTPVQIFAQNADVMKGSIGVASAKKIRKCIERACKTGTPLISVMDCSGARVDEGVSVLEAYADIIAAAADVADSVPHICVIEG
ncbi:MAG: methylmalonyl-CoA carboxyltransferase, partial [Clostridia bacterium]|nr:methylmalonyl-CoA carboxyltransferase [Clostridia bacterium]